MPRFASPTVHLFLVALAVTPVAALAQVGSFASGSAVGAGAAPMIAPTAPLDAQPASLGRLAARLTQTADSGAPSRGRFLASFPLAALLGTAGLVGGILAGYVYLGCEDEGSYCERGPANGELLTGAVGLALGAAAGAYLGGWRADSRGRFRADLLAASAGALVLVLDGAADPENTGALFFVGLVAAPLAAAMTDHSVRQPRRPRRVSIRPTPPPTPLGVMVTVRM